MTVSSAVNRNDYAGNGSTTSFAVSFRFLQNSDIKATLRDALSTETLQVETTDYTLTGAGGAGGGTLVMIVAPPSGTTLTIQRDVPATQETDYVENDEFPAESHEDALDKLTMLVQQQGEDSTRHIGFSDTVSDATGSAVELSQDATQRADKFLGFDSAGNIVTKTASVAGLVDQNQQDKRYGTIFATVAAMTAANPVSIDGVVVNLVAGLRVEIADYRAGETRGGKKGVIAASQAVDEKGDHTNNNGTVFIMDKPATVIMDKYGVSSTQTATFNTDAIQAAMDAGIPEPVIPAGSFTVEAQVTGNTFPAALYVPDKTTLRGLGIDASILGMADSQDQRGIVSGNLRGNPTLGGNGAPVTQNVDISLRDFTFNGNRVNQAAANQKSNIAFFNVLRGDTINVKSLNSAHHGIEYWQVTDGLVERNTVVDSAVTSIMIYKQNVRTMVRGNWCSGSGKDAGIGTSVTIDNDSTECSVMDNICRDDGWYNIVVSEGSNNCRVIGNMCIDATTKAGIALSEGQTGADTWGITVMGNTINSGGSHGIEIGGVRDCTIVGNTIVDNVSGIKVTDSNTNDTQRIVISSNIIRNIEASGIEVKPEGNPTNILDITIIGNDVSQLKVHGIWVEDADSIKVIGNRILDANKDNVNQDTSDSGIKVRDTPDCEISNNFVDGTFHVFGLWVNNSGAGLSPRLRVTNNTFRNATSADVTSDTADLTRLYLGNIPNGSEFGGTLGFRSGSNDPVTDAIVPLFTGEEFFKTATADWYKSYGDSASTQWKIIT